jgi:hypothetical protein
VTSNVDRNTGTNPSGKGDSEGWLWREGVFYEIYNSIVTSNESTMTSNECFEVDDTEGPDTVNAMQANDDPAADKGSDPLASYASSNVIACSEALKLNAFSPDNDGFNLAVWLAGGDGTAAIPLNNNTNNVVLTGADIPAVSLLDGGVGTRAYRTLELIQDSIGAEVFVQPDDLFDVSTLPERLPAFFSAPDYLGGASVNDDWLAGWTVGLDTALVP